MNLSYYATQELNPEYVERLRVAVRVAFPVKGCKLVPVSNPAKAQLILDPSFDSDTELLAMFLHFASLVPWPGRDSETLYFDIETHNAEKLWDMSPQEFFRMGQYAWGMEGEAHVTYDYDEMIELIRSAYGLVAHNGHPFDFTWALGDEALEWAREGRLFDTMVYGNLAYPAPFMFKDRNGREHFMEMAGQNKVVPHTMKWLSLDNLCYQLGTGGKVGSLRELAIKYNPPKTPVADLDYGLIDPSDEEFVDYGKGDITALQGVTRGLLMQRPISDYDWREQLCAAINAQISRNGFCVDVPMAQERVRVLEDRKTEIMAWLVKEFDFPTEGKAPWSSKVGKAAILEALASFGVVPNKDEGWPFGKTGPSLGGKVLLEFCKGTDAEDLAQALATLMGQRPLAAQALQYTHLDGKVHPSIVGFQKSGRLSCTEPSLSTWSAREEKAEEKSYFVADPGCVLLEGDLSNADARAVAAMSGDKGFAKRFEDGVDAHELTGRFMFGDTLYESDPKAYRFKAKACSHAFNYGAGSKKLAATAKVELEHAEKFVKFMHSSYPKLIAWQEKVRREGERGYVVNDWGRKMPVDEGRAYSVAPALYGQSSTREILFDGLIELPNDILRMVKATVHDAVILSIPRGREDEVRDCVVSVFDKEWNGVKFFMSYGRYAQDWEQAGHE